MSGMWRSEDNGEIGSLLTTLHGFCGPNLDCQASIVGVETSQPPKHKYIFHARVVIDRKPRGNRLTKAPNSENPLRDYFHKSS